MHSHLRQIAQRKGDIVINKNTGRRISAIVPVHVFGNPARIEEICSVAASWNIPVVEDAAEALGSWSANTPCGLVGDIGVISFNGNKILTTGGGGVLLTNRSDYAHRAKHLSTTAKVPHTWEYFHDEIGWNDRMPNINAALGVSQLEVLPEILEKKRVLYQSYKSAFSTLSDIHIINCLRGDISNNWLVTLYLGIPVDNDASSLQVHILNMAHQSGFLLRPIWKPLHFLPMYANHPRADSLKVSEFMSTRLINLPSSPHLAS